MMKRYAVTIEIETYATNREHALSQSLDVLANTEDNLATHCNRIVGIIHETDENGTPLHDATAEADRDQPRHPMTPDTIVILYDVTEIPGADRDEESPTWRGTIGEFIAANGCDEAAIAHIANRIANWGSYYFGGGAEPLTVLRLA